MIVEHRYRPPGQVAANFHRGNGFFRGIMGPFGSGKTISCCNEIFRRMCEMPPDRNGVRRSRWAAIRNTYPDLKGTTIKDWIEVVGQEVGRVIYSAPITQRIRFRGEDGIQVDAEMIFLALDREEDIRKLRGLQLTGLWLNEAKELPWGVVDRGLGRMGRYPKRNDVPDGYWYGAVADTNAPDEENWYYQKAEVEQPEDWEFYRQPGGVIRVNGRWEENPRAENLHNLPPGYYRKQLAGKSEDTIKADLGNIYTMVKSGKPVYEADYNDEIHSVDIIEPIPGVGLILGWDWGLTPSCCIEQVTPDGHLRSIMEIVGDNIGVRRFVRDMVKPILRSDFSNFEIVSSVGDPAGRGRSDTDEKTALLVVEEEGIPTVPAPSNNPERRLDAVRHYLGSLYGGRPAYQLSRKLCPMLRKGFVSGYAYPEYRIGGSNDKRVGERPMKNKYSHIHDAHQYVALHLREGYMIGEEEYDDDDGFNAADSVAGY